jgi:hypothetical protein
MRKREQMWAIYCGSYRFLYTGTEVTRSEAIAGFCRDTGNTWRFAYKHGNRAVRVTLSYEVPDAK